jgi:transcriptional regulator with XRE-family HTH domain
VTDVQNPEAARLADTLRAAMKSQSLSGSDLADEIERLTGGRPSAMQVSRWLRGERPLIRVSPDLTLIAGALNLDPVELICDAVRQAYGVEVPPRPSPDEYAGSPVLDIEQIGG